MTRQVFCKCHFNSVIKLFILFGLGSSKGLFAAPQFSRMRAAVNPETFLENYTRTKSLSLKAAASNQLGARNGLILLRLQSHESLRLKFSSLRLQGKARLYSKDLGFMKTIATADFFFLAMEALCKLGVQGKIASLTHCSSGVGRALSPARSNASNNESMSLSDLPEIFDLRPSDDEESILLDPKQADLSGANHPTESTHLDEGILKEDSQPASAEADLLVADLVKHRRVNTEAVIGEQPLKKLCSTLKHQRSITPHPIARQFSPEKLSIFLKTYNNLEKISERRALSKRPSAAVALRKKTPVAITISQKNLCSSSSSILPQTLQVANSEPPSFMRATISSSRRHIAPVDRGRNV